MVDLFRKNIEIQLNHGMCLAFFAGNGYKRQKRSFLRGSARISAEAANEWRFTKERSIATCRLRTIWRGDPVKKDIVTASPATLREKGLGGSPALNLYIIKKATKEGFLRSLSAVAAVWTAMQPGILHKPQRCRRRLKAFASA